MCCTGIEIWKGITSDWLSLFYNGNLTFARLSLYFSPTAQVEYQCEGFLHKNRDTVMEEQIVILKEEKIYELNETW